MGRKLHLPRLERSYYQGCAFVFWTLTFADRTHGWLNSASHSCFREIMLHAAAREALICPAYCLMPDHIHLLWMGLTFESDQLNGIRFLRTYLKPASGEHSWQHQAHDHLLREHEREADALMQTCSYILANPVRKGLATSEAAWAFSGAVVPGYPDLHPASEKFWDIFWKVYWQQREVPP